MKKVKKILDQILSQNQKPVIRIHIKNAQGLDPSDSKFGGTPYLPKKDYIIPQNHEGKNLLFLAQINCSQLPENDIYPKSGILQFWIFNDTLYGIDFDNPTSNKNFRVVYYENLQEYFSISQAGGIYKPYTGVDNVYTPIEGEFGLVFEKGMQSITPSCNGFEEKFVDLRNEENPNEEIGDIYDLMDEEYEYIYDSQNFSPVHQIGGYPTFTQTDRRNKYEDYDIVLLQIDSQSGKQRGWEILWGDVGIGNFFITPEQLKNKDFSKVLCNRDCG